MQWHFWFYYLKCRYTKHKFQWIFFTIHNIYTTYRMYVQMYLYILRNTINIECTSSMFETTDTCTSFYKNICYLSSEIDRVSLFLLYTCYVLYNNIHKTVYMFASTPESTSIPKPEKEIKNQTTFISISHVITYRRKVSTSTTMWFPNIYC